MKKFLTLLLICLSNSLVFAQAKVEISGQVKDANTKEAMEFCSVSVFNAKDSLITGSVTDNKGFFTIPLRRGNYHFIIHSIGYVADTIKAVSASENKFLGVYKLKPDDKYLNEVTITASAHENLIDKDVQIVTDKLREGAADTKDVLSKLNGVQYDRYNNSIKVDNNAKVIILVDGLEKDQEYIKNLSPDRLKKIEVIRSPSGRYALEGYSAVINIILKKDYQGTEIFVSERCMADPDAVKKEYIPVQNGVNASVNYVYNKLNVYSTYNNNYNNFNLHSTSIKEYANGLVIEKLFPDINDMNTKVKQMTNNYTLGADYYINPKHTISYEGNLKTQPSANNKTSEINDVIIRKNEIILSDLSSEGVNINSSTSSYNSLFYVGKVDEKNVFNSNFTYATYNDKYTNTYAENLLYKTIETGKDNKNSTKFYVEYVHTFNDNTNLQVGYGNTWEKSNNSFITNTLESLFTYSDLRHKLYAYYAWQKSKKLSVKFGGAAESSSRNANGQANSYLIYQPYADIMFKPISLINFKLKYRSESNYPNISQTNPFTTIIDQQSVSTGNPYLSPAVLHKVSLETNILDGLITVEPYYHFSNNYIADIGKLRSDSIFEYTYSNIGSYKNYGIETRFTIPFSKSFFLTSDINIFKSSIEYADKMNNLNNWTTSNQLIYQNHKSFTVVGLKYQKNLYKYITAQGYNSGDNDYWITFIQQPFFKKKMTVLLLYFFPINWGVDFNQGSYIKTDNYTETKRNDISFLKNMLMLQVSYRFNKGKTVNKTEKNIEQNNEKNTKSVM